MSEYSDRFFNSERTDLETFVERIHAKPVGVLRGNGSDDIQTVSVSVCFDHSHYGRIWSDDTAERIEISADCIPIDFEPAQHRNILFYGRMIARTEISGPPADPSVTSRWI